MNEELNNSFSSAEVFGQLDERVVCQCSSWCLELRPRQQEKHAKPQVVTNLSKLTSELLTVTEVIFQNLGICINLNITL